MTSHNDPLIRERGPASLLPVTFKGDTAFSITQKFLLNATEGIYGLGQHQDGYMNYRGRTVKLVQTNTDAVTPFLLSTMNYGILWDNYSKTIFQDDTSGASLWSEVANGIDYYFIAGATMDSVISGYRLLTGEAPLYGKWAYGYGRVRNIMKAGRNFYTSHRNIAHGKFPSIILFRTGITGMGQPIGDSSSLTKRIIPARKK